MSISNHGTVPAENAPTSETQQRPGLAIVVAVVLLLGAGFMLLLGLGVTAFAAMGGPSGLWWLLPVALTAVLTLPLGAAAVLAVRGHCGRWWVLGLSSLAPAFVTTVAGGARLPIYVVLFVSGWVALVVLSYVQPLRQWWARTP